MRRLPNTRNRHGAALWPWALAALLALDFWGQRVAAAEAGGAPDATANSPVGDDTSAAKQLEPFQASYRFEWKGMEVAVSNVNLQHQQDDTWVYSSEGHPRGLGVLYPMRPNLQSVMRINGSQVQPLSFKATGSGASHDANVQFNWQDGRATGVYEGAKVDMPIKPGVQDDLSLQIAMLDQLLQGGMPDKALEIDHNSVREYDYMRIDEEGLDTPLGHVDTIVYDAHHPGSPRTTRFWCAPSLGFIPLQVQQRRVNTVEWTMKIRSYHALGSVTPR